jgi:hypothetical protein
MDGFLGLGIGDWGDEEDGGDKKLKMLANK